MIDTNILEDELILYFSDKLGLEIDTNIFIGQIPITVGFGCAILINSKLHEGYGVVLNGNDYNFQIIGKYATRLEAMEIYNAMLEFNNIYDIELDNYKISTLFQAGDMLTPKQIEDDGKLKYMISYNGIISIVDNPNKLDNNQ